MALQIKRKDFELVKKRFNMENKSDKEAIKILAASGATAHLAKIYKAKGGIVGYANGGAVEIRSLPSGQQYKVVDGKYAGLVPKTSPPEPKPVAPPPAAPTPIPMQTMQVAPAQTSTPTPLPKPAPTPAPALDPSARGLIKTGTGHWAIQTVDGRTITTEKKLNRLCKPIVTL